MVLLYSLQKGGDSKRKDIFSTDSSFAPCAFNNKYKSSELLSLVCCKGARKNSKNNTGMRYKIGSTLQDKVNNGKAIVYLISKPINKMLSALILGSIKAESIVATDIAKNLLEELNAFLTIKNSMVKLYMTI